MGWSKRRRYRRYAPKDRTFAVLYEGCSKAGRVVSVSKGGLAFEYVPFEEADELPKKGEPPRIDLIVGPAPLYIEKIPCEVLYDFRVKDEAFITSRTETRCCGLKFGELSEEQTNGLDAFLKNYVADKERLPTA